MIRTILSLVLFSMWIVIRPVCGQSFRPLPVRPDGVLTNEELQNEGVYRLSDIFTLLNEWAGYSVEGFNWDVSANGLEPAQKNAWTLLVDGQPVNPGSLISKNINAVPLSIVQIDSIEVYNTPVLSEGVFAPAGLISIWTKKPERAIQFEGNIGAGNETGDPGPFYYTPGASPNIDRIGPSTDHFVSLAGSWWLFQYGLKTDEHHATDPQTIRRVYDLYNDPVRPRLLLSSPNVLIRVGGAGGWHTLYGGYTHFRDLTYIEAAGREVPNLYRYGHAGVNGDVRISNPLYFRYALGFESSVLGYRPNRIGLSFNWQQDRFRGNVEYGYHSRYIAMGLGTNIRYTRLGTTQTLTKPDVVLAEPYVVFQAGGTRINQQLSVLATSSEGKMGLKTVSTTTVHPTRMQRVELDASWIRTLPAEENDLWFWMSKGYRLPGVVFGTPQQPPYLVTSDAGSVDLKWTVQMGKGFEGMVTGSYRKFLRQRATLSNVLDVHPTEKWPEYFYFDVQTRGVIGASGEMVGATVGLSSDTGRPLHQQIRYSYLRPFSSQILYYDLWQVQPWHRMSYTARWKPVERFYLKLDARYTSPTHWPAYRSVNTESSGVYPDRLPANVLLNLSASKQFWGDHLRASFMIWNLLNRDIRYHPVGAIMRMTFFVQLNYRFSGGEMLK